MWFCRRRTSTGRAVPRLSQLTRPRPTGITVDVGDGDQVAISFDRNKVTPYWFTVMKDRAEALDTLATARSLSEVILEWDVTDDADVALPITPENVAMLSLTGLQALSERIVEAAAPGAAEGNASANTSSSAPTASASAPVSPLNGQQPSQLPEPSASLSST